ncbi:hypothetical protein FACS189483_10980 [Spirochaetia bacterium]|nr:hypothetical protein FACS189483_10980 [Spirochaetia bacterium]
MITLKRIAAVVVVLFASLSMAMGQTSGQRELSVEESYLQDSVELMIIREQSRSDSRDMKFVALEYISAAIARGNTGEEMRSTLDYLALEGIANRTRENGRLVNNYPDVRLRAVTYLGDLGTAEAKDTLIKVILAENEPMVLAEAVKSLARIGLNDNEETVNAISWVITRFDVLNPDNTLALSALDAYEKFAETSGGIKDPTTIRAIMRIVESGSYNRIVKERAQQILANLRRSSNSDR